METRPHPNFTKSSNLIFISFGVAVFGTFLIRNQLITPEQKSLSAISMLFIFGLAFLVRQGYSWVKYLLLGLTVLGLFSMIMVIEDVIKDPIVGLINLIQTALQIWSTVLLFQISKIKEEQNA